MPRISKSAEPNFLNDDLAFPNDIGIRGTETGGTTRSLIRMDTSDRVNVGNSASVSRIAGTALLIVPPPGLPSAAVAGVPAAGTAGRLHYVTNGDAGSPCLAIDNGTNWLVVSLGATISAT